MGTIGGMGDRVFESGEGGEVLARTAFEMGRLRAAIKPSTFFLLMNARVKGTTAVRDIMMDVSQVQAIVL